MSYAPQRRLGLMIVCGGCLLMAGCGGSAVGTVTGKVSYKKEFLPFGKVQFFQGEALVGEGIIDKQGGYTIDNVPTGQVTICIWTRADLPPDLNVPPPPGKKYVIPEDTVANAPPLPPGAGGPPDAAKPPLPEGFDPRLFPIAVRAKFEPLHDKYSDRNVSKLTYTVEPGMQKHDILLK